ncbi:MAG TPA: sugar ABC transporter permease [Devosia sp.]|jgi:lactose/L-arabinose transport system permease protein|uniref:carbohydrate ABC transporter permease n=1 Tax=Devosia sp. TaxID=1871048 RepID=UPI002DDD2E67|nr:sugar ABC transporter permease [Devosia sp.]HEV2515803.1 sugar ABC transporter permease [Devosia sp.]
MTAPNTQPAVRRRWRGSAPRATPYLFLLPVIVLFLAFKVYPYVYAAWLSLTKIQKGKQVFVGLGNYGRLLTDPIFYKALSNTLLILVIQVPLMLGLALLLAVAFNSALLKWRAIWRTAYFVPIVMGLVAYGILFSTLLNNHYGVINFALESIGLPRVPWLGDPFWAKISIIIALTWHYTGNSAVIYLAQLQSVPGELYEAAEIDGASAFQRFWHITLPGLRPAITLTVVLSTIGTLQLFDEPYVLTNGGPNNATLTIGMYLYQNGFKYFDFGYASAIGYVLTGIIGILALIQFRLLREKRA